MTGLGPGWPGGDGDHDPQARLFPADGRLPDAVRAVLGGGAVLLGGRGRGDFGGGHGDSADRRHGRQRRGRIKPPWTRARLADVLAPCAGQPGTGSAAQRKLMRATEPTGGDPVVTAIPDITLSNGQNIPQLGFGVFLVKPEETVDAVTPGLQVGCRHIDTAEMYGNEKEVGEAISRSDLDRGDVFVTSKLANDAHEPDDARRAFDESLKALGFDYLDLFLIHWPLPTRYDGDYVSTWKTLEEFY